jgi:hypothetical protein
VAPSADEPDVGGVVEDVEDFPRGKVAPFRVRRPSALRVAAIVFIPVPARNNSSIRCTARPSRIDQPLALLPFRTTP